MMKVFTAVIAAGFIAAWLTGVSGAFQYSDSNKGIDIVYGDFAGYRFAAPNTPAEEDTGAQINTSEIAKVKFYIKCPDLEHIDVATVKLAYNSGTTNWVEIEHDLKDGLIVDMDVPGVVEGDFFDAGLGTWNEGVWGTFSVVAVDVEGNVLGSAIYGEGVTPEPPEPTEPTEPIEPTQPTEQVGGAEHQPTQPPVNQQEENAPTGSAQIATAVVMTALSVFAISNLRKKKDS